MTEPTLTTAEGARARELRAYYVRQGLSRQQAWEVAVGEVLADRLPAPPTQVDVAVLECPPSLNDVAGQGTRYRWIAAKKHWYGVLSTALQAAGMEPCASVYVEGRITFPNRIKRDQGNYRSPLEKFLGDSLQRGGYLPDDDWQHYQFGDLQAGYEPRVSRTDLVLFCSGAALSAPPSSIESKGQ